MIKFSAFSLFRFFAFLMPSPPAPILLNAALRDEMNPTAKALGLSLHDASSSVTINDQKILALITGMGALRMTTALAKAIDAHHPARLILLGFSGGLDPSLTTGHTITATTVLNTQGQAIDLTGHLPRLHRSDGSHNPLTTLLTTDQIICDPAQKKTLGQQHRAAAVDLESFHLAKLAADRQIPLTIIRAISDTADFALPASIGNWVKSDGSPSIIKVLGDLLRHPFLLPVLLQLRKHTQAAAGQLAIQVKAMVASR